MGMSMSVGVHESERRMNLIHKPTPSPHPQFHRCYESDTND
jgi:hypothetical protein